MAIYVRTRPQSLSEIEGNHDTVNSLQNILQRKRADIPHVFLFCGPSGCGKTTLARIVAKGIADNCELREIDVADYRGIETIRDLREEIQFFPAFGSVRVVIMDEVHRCTSDAQAAMLKTLEDTPNHTYFILCTNEPEKLSTPIRNRCSTYHVELLSEPGLIKVMNLALDKENCNVEDEILAKIAEKANGSPRQALVMLDQIVGLPSNLRLEAIATMNRVQAKAIDLCRALAKKAHWRDISAILKGMEGEDPEGVRRAVLGYFTTILLNRGDADTFMVMEAFRQPFYDQGPKTGLVMAAFLAANRGK